MQSSAWIGLVFFLVMASNTKVEPPPVILNLGPVVPTPAPTPKGAERKRLITTITVQNSAAGDTVVTFEATDVADEGNDKIRTLAVKDYALSEENPELKPLRDRILRQERELERVMLEYVEKAGPPKERAPIEPQQPG